MFKKLIVFIFIILIGSTEFLYSSEHLAPHSFKYSPLQLEILMLRGKAQGAPTSRKAGSCKAQTIQLAKYLFRTSDLRINVYWNTKHYVLKTESGIILCPTIEQFFNTTSETPELFVGTKEELIKRLDDLLKEYGPNTRLLNSKYRTGELIYDFLYSSMEPVPSYDGKLLYKIVNRRGIEKVYHSS